MGTTAQKLQRVLDTKNAISSAIIDKGGTLAANAAFANYAAAILALQTGGGDTSAIITAINAAKPGLLASDATTAQIAASISSFRPASFEKRRTFTFTPTTTSLPCLLTAYYINYNDLYLATMGGTNSVCYPEIAILTSAAYENGVQKSPLCQYATDLDTYDPTMSSEVCNGQSVALVPAWGGSMFDRNNYLSGTPILIPYGTAHSCTIFIRYEFPSILHFGIELTSGTEAGYFYDYLYPGSGSLNIFGISDLFTSWCPASATDISLSGTTPGGFTSLATTYTDLER